ncbi:S-layer homology domain-containing protein [Neglectibacter timonensis]|uniref:S-layer homology domain-containing protein n=1 Tax=Neglectibacter timonensis TaxID=1776382 RepID=A0ABT1S3X4_9FIRM|nr:S-layer homology domain-containing protein [Neglectibacter timonensis]MCQ4841513.1 S-layer homology domain-containing protein [Neglectibacter timonensis]MCQ4844807.1 S-layer homology domain-containing protein [Neglectibacter timonensis]
MKKSKFLKKSLATLLALMLVVAMIPMSAAAAEYEPASGFTPVVDGTLTKTAGGWAAEFNYGATPEVTFEITNTDEKVSYIDNNSNTVANATSITLWEKDGAPAPVEFWVVNGTEESKHYTLTWSVKAAASDVSVKEAKIGNYTGVVNETDRTIKFTLPFGYKEKNTTVAPTITFNGVKSAPAMPADLTVGTNKVKAVEAKITVQPQDDSKDITYTVTAVEEEGLTSISIGDYKGVFLKNAADPNKGYETGTIEFTIPADLAKDTNNKLNLVPTFEVGSNYNKATLDINEIKNGEEFDFAGLLDATTTGQKFEITNTDGKRAYTLVMKRADTDTAITGFTATAKDSSSTDVLPVEGTVNGEALTVEVPANSDLSKNVKLDFVGPKAFTGNTDEPTIEATSPVLAAVDFSTDGKATLTLTSYTAPVRLKVTAADTKTIKYYTLTVTKAAEANKNPQVTSAKLTLNKDTENEASYTASIDQAAKTITFNLPHSTLDTDIQSGEYTFGKTALTKLDDTVLTTATFKDGSSVTVTSDAGDKIAYTVKYVRNTAQTGKSISDFVLSTADNINLKDYNNNKNFNVTVSGNEFKVTLPTTVPTLYGQFTLSEGAKLYVVTGDTDTNPVAVSAYNTKTGAAGAAIDVTTKTKIYFVADEKLATDIANGTLNGKKYGQIKNMYRTNYAEYKFNVTPADREGARLTSLSADDGKVTASINGEDITLTVPYSYVDGKTFFFDFTVSDGATLKLHSTPYYPVYSSGLKTYNAATGKLVTAAAGFTSNPDFQIKKDASDNNKVKVYYTDGKTWNLNDNAYLQVVAEDGTTTKDYKIKEVKVADAEKGAEITALKANNTNATISGKNINVTLPYGTNLGQVKLAITASKMAKVDFNEYDPTDPDKTYVLTSPLSIKVVSEDGNTTNVYTLKATVASKFVDVPEDAWYYDYVMAAAKAGIVNGKENSRFDPEGAVSRRDFALMLTRMLGVDVSGYTNTPFNDVKADDYALGAIAYCAENGIVGGDGKGNFLPGDSITREEAAKMISVAKELTGTTTEKFKDDAKISNWAKGYVDACKAAGIFGGDEKGNFNPKSPITRAETAKIMVVAMGK